MVRRRAARSSMARRLETARVDRWPLAAVAGAVGSLVWAGGGGGVGGRWSGWEGGEGGGGTPPLLPVQLVAAGKVPALDPGPHGGGSFPEQCGQVVHREVNGGPWPWEGGAWCGRVIGKAAQ